VVPCVSLTLRAVSRGGRRPAHSRSINSRASVPTFNAQPCQVPKHLPCRSASAIQPAFPRPAPPPRHFPRLDPPQLSPYLPCCEAGRAISQVGQGNGARQRVAESMRASPHRCWSGPARNGSFLRSWICPAKKTTPKAARPRQRIGFRAGARPDAATGESGEQPPLSTCSSTLRPPPCAQNQHRQRSRRVPSDRFFGALRVGPLYWFAIFTAHVFFPKRLRSFLANGLLKTRRRPKRGTPESQLTPSAARQKKKKNRAATDRRVYFRWRVERGPLRRITRARSTSNAACTKTEQRARSGRQPWQSSGPDDAPIWQRKMTPLDFARQAATAASSNRPPKILVWQMPAKT